ncbi:hypothetical protein G7Z17_g10403 [Cylindrodendrum hubeiense]|uniref:Uncharacterized protein n=1 Tax=Cylindrodendrum hubeiense TaxID=595255 RepID=A0A9P5GZK6_9HYPO|nr:hypothetical protein G7Z17_g10403 [Cylindrodendrum hubeiense]
MEAMAAAVGIAQLLGQTIEVIQTIRRSLARVHQAGAVITNYQAQLDNLFQTLELIGDEKELHTSSIRDQLEFLHSICKDIRCSFEELRQFQGKSKPRQFINALVTNDEDKEMLQNLFDKLHRATTNLNTRILATNVGISSDMRGGLIATWPIIQRVDQNVQRILGQRIAIAERLEAQRARAEEGKYSFAS